MSGDCPAPQRLRSFPTRRSSDLERKAAARRRGAQDQGQDHRAHSTNAGIATPASACRSPAPANRSEEHTSELQSHHDLVCRLLLEKKKQPAADKEIAQRPKDLAG